MIKLDSLERKIMVYLVGRILENEHDAKIMAHDIAEICEKEYENKIDCDLCNDLQDENIELKQQIDRLHKNEIIYHKRLNDKHIDDVEVVTKCDELEIENTAINQCIECGYKTYDHSCPVCSGIVRTGKN